MYNEHFVKYNSAGVAASRGVQKKESIGDLAQIFGVLLRRACFLLLFSNVTIVWEEYMSEDNCVTKRQASVGPPKISRLHLRNFTLVRVAKIVLLFRALNV